jgi:GTP cyclohydrolase I
MPEKTYLSWGEVFEALELIDVEENVIYGVPKGGMIAAGFLKRAEVTHDVRKANMILDDLIDSGWTRDHYQTTYPDKDFAALIDKTNMNPKPWIVFPWEKEHPCGEESVEQNITRMLEYIGEDPGREGLKETPERVVRSWDEIFAGYNQSPADVCKIFDDEQVGGLVYLKGIEFFSTCEHHWLPFYGEAVIAYIPNGPVIGVSKLARLLDIYARRLQIQERIAEQVTDALMEYLKPLGAACIIEAKHLCMACRGVKKQSSVMGYSSMKGAFLDDAKARAELIALTR